MKSVNSMRVNEDVAIDPQPATKLKMSLAMYIMLGIVQVL